MKNALKISMLTLIVMAVVFSCKKKDDDANSNSTTPNSNTGIVGTSWVYKQQSYADTLSFIDKEKVRQHGIDQTGNYDENGTYEYTSPNIIITINGVPISGTINGNEMIINGMGHYEKI